MFPGKHNFFNMDIYCHFIQAYKNIGDIDAIPAYGMSHIMQLDSRVEHYSTLGRWDQAVLHYDLVLRDTNLTTFKTEYMHALKQSGLYHYANQFAQTQNTQEYECLWRLSDWSQNTRGDQITNFNKSQYCALKSYYDQESPSIHLMHGRKSILEMVKLENLETTRNLYSILSKLQLLQEIEDFESAGSLEEILSKWKNPIEFHDFRYVEPILAQRLILLETINNRNAGDCKDALIEMELEVIGLARKNGWFQVSKSILFKLKQRFPDMDNVQQSKVFLEEAKFEWGMGLDKKMASSIMHSLLSTDFGGDNLLKSQASMLYGNWLMETQSENPNSYFNDALEIMETLNLTGSEEDENRHASYAALAKFADHEYQQVNEYSIVVYSNQILTV